MSGEYCEKHSNWLRCETCGAFKPDAVERPDEYTMDVENDPDATHVICDACQKDFETYKS